ncbi:hypothetical protein B0T19DRAFT_446103 [Cercophora scortea]|uniref:Uncharacterized protein n=1 Tax=Cercophora scortea TaxID=314031 RepID=A0AAE0I839_9PEZI|nr:hypothetical protein B0T19DRAFT_446103 [Cercophora scortea]
MANHEKSTGCCCSSDPLTLAVLGLDGADRALFFQDVAGTSPPARDDERRSATAARIFKTTIGTRSLSLIDTPSVGSDGELIRAVDQALEDESAGQATKHTVQAAVYLHNDINQPVTREHVQRNLATFKKLLSTQSQGSVLIVTTGWPALSATGFDEALRHEDELTTMYAAPPLTIIVERGQSFISGESRYRGAVSSFLNNIQVCQGLGSRLRRYNNENSAIPVREQDQQASSLAAELAALKETLNKQSSELELATAQQKALAEKLKHAEEVAEQLAAQLRKSEIEKAQLSQQLNEARPVKDSPAPADNVKADEEAKRATVDLNVLDANGGFPLYGAAAGGDYDQTKRMLEQGADPSMRTRFRWTALHWAVGNEHDDVVELLLAHGADVNAVSDTGMTPLGMARSEAVRRMLLEKGATG